MKLVIFDIDGTLVRATRFEDEAFLSTFRLEFGLGEVDGDWSAYSNVTDSGILAEVFQARTQRPPTSAETRRFRSRYFASMHAGLVEHPEEAAEIPGAAAFVNQLRADPEWRVALATGNWRQIALWKLRRAGIPWRDLPMACADEGLAREELLRVAVDRAASREGGLRFDSIVSVGDAPWDARAATALGFAFIGIGARWQESSDWPCAGHALDYHDGPAVRAMLDSAIPSM